MSVQVPPPSQDKHRIVITQADAVIAKFGNASRLARLLELAVSTVCRWTYPAANGGTDGLIPPKQLRRILALAPAHGVAITANDLYPTR